jgi:putative hydrolase of the HAD superfamily
MPSGKIKAITFDVGGTMIHPWPSVGHVYASAAFKHNQSSLDASELNHRFIMAWRNRINFDYSYTAWGRLVDATFTGLLAKPPSETFFPDLYRAFAKPENWKLYTDVIPTLEELASREIPLAIISNWDERLRPLLSALKLSGYFQSMLISCEIYFLKPSNVIFDHALRSLGVPAESVLHVGDSVSEDVSGARATGLQAVLIDRLGTREPGRITSLGELVEMVPEG